MVRSRVLSILLTHILRDKIPDTRINVILLVADKIFAWAASVTTIANSNIIINLIFVKKIIFLDKPYKCMYNNNCL